MKSSLLVTSALGAVFIAAPAMAQDDVVTGYADVSYSDINLDTPFGDDDTEGWSIGGAVEIPLQSWGMQFDVRYTDVDEFSDQGVIQGTAHVHAMSDSYRVGGFAGFADQDTDQLWVIGAEGQFYMDQITLSGTLGYGQIDDADTDFWGARGGLDFFVQENFRLDLDGGWTQIDDSFDEVDVWSIGVGAEYQFATVPLSVFAGYAHSEFDEDVLDLSSDVIRVGLRWNFGGTTLLSRDRTGASFAPLGGIAGAGFPIF